jgi:hypothetical protein
MKIRAETKTVEKNQFGILQARAARAALHFLLSVGALTFGLIVHGSSGAEISARVIDGLGRPLPEATVEVRLTQKAASGKITNVYWLRLTADRDGRVKGRYDEKRDFADDFRVSLSGYSGYSTGLRSEYVLQRKVGAKDLRRTARLRGESQKTALRDFLVGDYEAKSGDEGLNDLMFLHYQDLRDALRALVQDPNVGTRATERLSLIGVPEDLRLIIQHAPEPKSGSFANRWAYQVVCALFEPQTAAEWTFLKKCAANMYDDGWVDFGAIETLRLIASPQSHKALSELKEKNGERQRQISEALKYIDSNPRPIVSTNVVEAGNLVAQALQIGSWEKNDVPRLNDEGDMALIDCEFREGRDRLTYTATFHLVAGVWRLRGLRETSQTFMALPPNRKLFVGAWNGFSSSHLAFARLELNDNDTGQLAISYLPDSAPEIYRVTKWMVQGYEVLITVEPAEPTAEPITLQHVSYGIQSLELELHGKGWMRKMSLFNEGDFEGRAGAAKKALKK